MARGERDEGLFGRLRPHEAHGKPVAVGGQRGADASAPDAERVAGEAEGASSGQPAVAVADPDAAEEMPVVVRRYTAAERGV